MTSRERVRRFLAGEPVDWIPNGLGGCETAGLHNVAYHKLKKILGVDDPANRVCTFMNNAIFEPSVLEAIEGDTRGITIGPEMWRRIYKPHYKRLFTEWHRITKMKVNLHTCGAMSDILGDLVECGVDIYNPVQISANNMAPEILEARFGKKLIFYGGVYDAVKYGGEASADAVYDAVKANIRTFSAGGGYIFAGVHNLPPDMPEAHLKAMLAAYRDCRAERLA